MVNEPLEREIPTKHIASANSRRWEEAGTNYWGLVCLKGGPGLKYIAPPLF